MKIDDQSPENYALGWGCDPSYDHFPRESGDGELFYQFVNHPHEPEFLAKFIPAIGRTMRGLKDDHEERPNLERLMKTCLKRFALADLDEFTRAYITAMLWSTNDESTPEGGEPMDANYGPEDISQECLDRIVAACRQFQEENRADIEAAERMTTEGTWRLPAGADCTVREYAGHDFWLSRVGHGCGFWDGDWPDGIGERLDASAEKFGEVWIEVGDDALIHGH